MIDENLCSNHLWDGSPAAPVAHTLAGISPADKPPVNLVSTMKPHITAPVTESIRAALPSANIFAQTERWKCTKLKRKTRK